MENNNTFSGFELNGYSIDYVQDGKYLGSIRIEEKDREVFGYHGRKYHTAEEDLIIPKGRNQSKIKKGSKYYTEMQAICGKMVR